MSPPRCARCAAAAALRRPRTGQPLCRLCFVGAFEEETLRAVAAGRPTLSPGTTVAVAASGGKDSSVLSHVLARLSGRLGLRLLLLSVDEGISGYRDASLAAVRRHRGHLPLLLVSHEGLYGWSMDRVAAGLPRGGHCTVCGVLRRRALERAARALGIHALATGHNADDIAETVLMNFLRGDVARLRRTATEATGATSEATGATGEATEATGEATEAMATTRIPETATRMDTEATRATAEMTTMASEATRSTTKATRSPMERTNSTDATISSAEATKDFMETTRSSVETTRDPIGTTRSPVELPEVMEATKNLPEATKTSVNATKSSMKPPRNRQKATGSSMEAAGSHMEGSRSSTEGSRRPQGLARPVASAEAAPLPAVPRCKPLRHAYEKEIVLYAHFEGLDYVSTECVYAPQAYRGHARTLLKELEATRASAVAALGHSGRFLAVREQVATKALRACSQCGFAASQPLCKACVLLASLERGLPRLALGKRVPGVAIRDGGQWVTELGDGELGGGGHGVGDHGVSGHGGCCRGGGHGASGLEVNGHQVGGHGHGHGDGGRGVGGHGASCHGSADHGVGDQGPGGHGACCSGPGGHGEGGRGPGGPVPCSHGPGVPGPRGQGAGDEVEVEVVVGRGGRGQRRRVRGLGRVRGALNIWDF